MITKGAEPNSLTHHRVQAHSDYDNYTQKDDLRAALVGEQRGLCCYCTGRVRAESTAMKIEHWQSQANYPQQQLVYGNLLGACLGGEGRSPLEQHCDTKKANRDLKWNPADTAHAIETRLKYLVDGTIVSSDEHFNTQLNNTLGLNFSYLKSSRKAVLDSILQWWRSTPNARQKVQQQINYRINAAEYQPFSPVAIWFLRQKL
ncbi:retron system putative HNH endonuclease [Rhizobium bangladeshense]|uniref:retron system putative HNH endonuclease n=1 Tax=Rhizobium bangladeshense TaxID=1138189 RepID=UPI001C828C4B|nr:retron system putative HNH endonuclease [Rhizobium bangladeshense]MBX4916719.1 TIGR02646 family protein [Rhizobium bangladeshense]